jgi:glycosyltransferase involved in cell wall biosynthesis
MACNCPIVSTDVGDVSWITKDVEGTYVANTFDPLELASLLQKALLYNERTKGRERMQNLNLTVEKIAQRIISVYSGIMA